MARSRSRAPSGGARGKRETRATSKKAVVATAVEVEVVEEKKGFTIDDGIVLMTTVILVVAFFMTDYVIGTDYGGGAFFGG